LHRRRRPDLAAGAFGGLGLGRRAAGVWTAPAPPAAPSPAGNSSRGKPSASAARLSAARPPSAAAFPGPGSSSGGPGSSSSSSPSPPAAFAASAAAAAFTVGPPAAAAAALSASPPPALAPLPSPAAAGGKVGVLLLNLGGPESLDDVRPFLYNLFADPDIIRLPSGLRWLQPALASLIATLRAPKSAEGYKAIGGGSPLRRITEEQGAALEAALRERGLDGAGCYVAMRYWAPYTEEALESVVRDGVRRLVILPLYPQFSISTSGSSLRLLEQLLRQDPALAALPHTVIPSWYQRPGYVGAMADLIEAELATFGDGREGREAGAAAAVAASRSSGVGSSSAAVGGVNSQVGDELPVHLFFSAHGVPKSYVEEAGDPYKEEMEECVGLIVRELERRRGGRVAAAQQQAAAAGGSGSGNISAAAALNERALDHTLAYQSRVGPVEWLTPYTDVSIRDLGARGVRRMLAVPVSFVSEHIETLEEMDVEYRELAEASGIDQWRRVPALNTHPRFIADLADAVVEALPYVGCLAATGVELGAAPGSGPNGGGGLVPMGDLEALLDAYDRGRSRTLPAPVGPWEWGWTKSAETWNGRLAMVALASVLLLEAATGQGVLSRLLTLE